MSQIIALNFSKHFKIHSNKNNIFRVCTVKSENKKFYSKTQRKTGNKLNLKLK